MGKVDRSFVKEPLDSLDLLCLRHILLLVLPYYLADLLAFITSHNSTEEVREMAKVCSSTNSEGLASVLE